MTCHIQPPCLHQLCQPSQPAEQLNPTRPTHRGTSCCPSRMQLVWHDDAAAAGGFATAGTAGAAAAAAALAARSPHVSARHKCAEWQRCSAAPLCSPVLTHGPSGLTLRPARAASCSAPQAGPTQRRLARDASCNTPDAPDASPVPTACGCIMPSANHIMQPSVCKPDTWRVRRHAAPCLTLPLALAAAPQGYGMPRQTRLQLPLPPAATCGHAVDTVVCTVYTVWSQLAPWWWPAVTAWAPRPAELAGCWQSPQGSPPLSSLCHMVKVSMVLQICTGSVRPTASQRQRALPAGVRHRAQHVVHQHQPACPSAPHNC
jgi:hypothetical protein